MNKSKGFTLIELLAVILILGIIALIAIPTVNSILKESRTGAWKSTASQMTKAAENYFQLKQIKNENYVKDFKTGQASTGYITASVNQGNTKDEIKVGDYYIRIDPSAPSTNANDEELHAYMLSCLSLKGDIPKFDEIDLFQIDTNGAVALAFSNTNAYCMTVDGNADFTAAEYNTVKNNAATGSFNASGLFATAGESPVTTKLKIGGTAVCVSR